MHVLALADDLTGALETGAKFAAAGVNALVSADAASVPDAPVLVLDTETRHLPPGEAAERVERLARAARGNGARFLYCKTDSTLRGNIGAELAAASRAWGGQVHYAPAYPRMGRTVRDGRLYVDGVPLDQTAFAHDPLNPVRDSDIARILGPWAAAVRIWDGESDSDVFEAARAMVAGSGAAAGPAALAEALAVLTDLPRGPVAGWPPLRSALLVNGSLHPVSRAQQEHAEAHGWGPPPWAVLRIPDRPGESGSERACRVGAIVARMLDETAFDSLIVFGGDTAYGIARALACPLLRPLREVVPGVPISRASIGGRDFHLITKAGGFGPPAVLAAVRAMIEKGS